ncbi:M20 family metallopeptidase [Corynebacterium phoceense]|uniref:M20 family metallopeptidase n=1 Tax=Corynebacterium phoceense TaxID=1686286 RepID=UPI00211BB944|nr:M20 family metallopeptidase [Corynebacterium phoceense]MCQ9334192.1 M20 family metallopeptidase [Corynebacterium phoceense]
MADSPEEHPTVPSTAYLDAMHRQLEGDIERVIEAAVAPTAPTAAWDLIEKCVEDLTDTLNHIVADLHAHPETAFEEYRSSALLADIIEERGFAVTRGAYGVETAFEASWQSLDFDESKHPTVAILAEYDALPGIGHACGHNIIAAAGVGAFLALTAALQRMETVPAGRIVVLGTPAEEGHTGKEYMIRGGALDGVDCAMMVHGFGYDIASHVWLGRRSATITFEGVPAHASSSPFMGRNALDAATLAYQGLGLLRQQMPPGDRLHAIIEDGGDSPNVIPRHASLNLYVRSGEVETLLDLSRRVDDIMHGAALMSGCGYRVEWDLNPMSLPVRNNEALAQRWARTQSLRGRVALPAGVVPETLAASTDFGNVSHLVPGIHPVIKVSPDDVALHTEAFREWAISDNARTAAADAAVGLAQTAFDVLADPELLDAARAEFAEAGGQQSVEQLLSGEHQI